MIIKKCRLISLILTFIMVFSICPNTYASENTADVNTEITGDEAANYIEQAIAFTLSRYKFDVDKEELYKSALENIIKENPQLLDTAFKGMFNSLDDYSTYYTEEELNSFFNDMSGEICGIGVLVTASETGLIVSNVYDNTPAKEAGLAQGDIITHADGTYLGNMDIELAKQYIIGPEYTTVTITILRNGITFDKTIQRRKVVIDAGIYQAIENDTIGYIQLNEFNNNAAEFIKKALNEFDIKSIKNIIIDLRNNPGGGLNELVDVCSLFIPSGPAIHLEYKNPFKFVTLYAENENETPKYNLAVLINENSASASEAFSAAVQDTGVGIVIGESSFGKGTMQNITPFIIGGGIKLTEAVYLSPNGRSINGTGVTPDVKVTDKITTYETADITPLTYERVLKIGDTGDDVLAVEERLSLLGFSIGVPDKIFDYQTFIAVQSFQRATELYPYGVMDYTTQTKLDSILMGSEIRNNMSYKKAVEIFKAGNWQKYKQDWSK